jgi:hypothetical protein
MIHLTDSQRSRNTAPFLSKVGGDRSTHVYGTASALALRAFTGAANYLTILQGSQLSMVQHHVGSRTVPLPMRVLVFQPRHWLHKEHLTDHRGSCISDRR